MKRRILVAVVLAIVSILYVREIAFIFPQEGVKIFNASPLFITPISLLIDLVQSMRIKFLASLLLFFPIIYIYLIYIGFQLQFSVSLLLIILILSISASLISAINKGSLLLILASYYLPTLVLVSPQIYNYSNDPTSYFSSLILALALGTSIIVINLIILGISKVSSMPSPFSPSTISAYISLFISLTILKIINSGFKEQVSFPDFSTIINLFYPIYILTMIEGILSVIILRISLIRIKREKLKQNNLTQKFTVNVITKGNLSNGNEIEIVVNTLDPSGRKVEIKDAFLEIITPNKTIERLKLKNRDNVKSAKYRLRESGEYKIIVKGKNGLIYSEYRIFVTDKTQSEGLDPKIWVGKELYGYRIVEVIGIGGTGYVLKGVKENRQAAIKVLKLLDKYSIDDIAREISNVSILTLKEGSEKYLVGVYEVHYNRDILKQSIVENNLARYIENPPAIIMEYMEGGTAYDLIKNDQFFYSNYWDDIVCNIIKNIAHGIFILHGEGYVHLDIKPQNIFFNSKIPSSPFELLSDLKSGRRRVKLGDFGSTVKEGEKYYFATPHYASGEQIIEAIKIYKGIPSTGAKKYMDVYSLGSTAYTLLTRSYLNTPNLINIFENAFTSKDIEVVKKAWEEFDPKANLERIKKSKLYYIISKMVEKDPLKRLTIEKVVEELNRIC
ncbi:MAG: protein kinase [Sulfolobaceae archaeon]